MGEHMQHDASPPRGYKIQMTNYMIQSDNAGSVMQEVFGDFLNDHCIFGYGPTDCLCSDVVVFHE
jgi:hypothetical protein